MPIATKLAILMPNGHVSLTLNVHEKPAPETPEEQSTKRFAGGAGNTPMKNCSRCLSAHAAGQCMIPFMCGKPFVATHDGTCDMPTSAAARSPRALHSTSSASR